MKMIRDRRQAVPADTVYVQLPRTQNPEPRTHTPCADHLSQKILVHADSTDVIPEQQQ